MLVPPRAENRAPVQCNRPLLGIYPKDPKSVSRDYVYCYSTKKKNKNKIWEPGYSPIDEWIKKMSFIIFRCKEEWNWNPERGR